MSTQEKVRRVVWIAVFVSLLGFLYVDVSKELLPQMAVSLVFLPPTFLVLYHVAKGRNWARILLVIFSVFGLFDFLAVPFAPNLMAAVAAVIGGLFSIYLLVFLNSTQTLQWFTATAAQTPKSKARLLKTVIIVTIAVVGLLGGTVAWGIHWLKGHVEHMDVWIEDVQSGEITQIADGGVNGRARFSPNGTHIVYQHAAQAGARSGSDICVYSIADRQTTTVVGDGRVNLNPSWDPTGTRILYASKDGNNADLWIHSLEDGTKTQLTNDAAWEENSLWSPDGHWVLFTQQGENRQDELYVMSVESKTKRQLTRTDNILDEPKWCTWSADSTRIACVKLISIVIVDREGAVHQTLNLTGLNNLSGLIFWPADSDVLLVRARPADSTRLDSQLYKVSRKTAGFEVWKTGRPLWEFNLDASPDGKQIAYTRPSAQHR